MSRTTPEPAAEPPPQPGPAQEQTPCTVPNSSYSSPSGDASILAARSRSAVWVGLPGSAVHTTSCCSGSSAQVTVDRSRVRSPATGCRSSPTNNAQGGYLPVKQLQLALHGVQVTSLTARSAEANLATGTLTLSYEALSGVVTRLASTGGPVRISQAAGSTEQAARVKVTDTADGRELNSTGTLLAQRERDLPPGEPTPPNRG